MTLFVRKQLHRRDTWQSRELLVLQTISMPLRIAHRIENKNKKKYNFYKDFLNVIEKTKKNYRNMKFFLLILYI